MFKKYPSLTQGYASKDIDRHLRLFGQKVMECNWHLSEKIHGANMSFLLQPRLAPKYFSRNQEVTGQGFYNSDELLDYIAYDKLSPVQKWVNSRGRSIRMFGELYGPGIQKGVDYGPERKVKFYDLMQNENWRTQQDLETFFYDIGIGYMLVPKLAILPTFKDAMEYCIDFNSNLSDKEDNQAEGFVVKPYDEVFEDINGSLFYVKHVHPKFKEKQGVKKIRTETQYSEAVNDAKAEFLSYINKNRIASVFSKEGEIQSHAELHKFIPLIYADAMEDFRKDSNFIDEEFTKPERKYIFNISKQIVELLKEFL